MHQFPEFCLIAKVSTGYEICQSRCFFFFPYLFVFFLVGCFLLVSWFVSSLFSSMSAYHCSSAYILFVRYFCHYSSSCCLEPTSKLTPKLPAHMEAATSCERDLCQLCPFEKRPRIETYWKFCSGNFLKWHNCIKSWVYCIAKSASVSYSDAALITAKIN